MWWEHCDRRIQAPQERQGRKEGKTGGEGLYMKEQLEHL